MKSGPRSKRRWLEPAMPTVRWEDSRLVRECLAGNEQAWSALIDKYKNLIYSIPIKYHASAEEAADIFQAVCLELFSELSRLRKTESVRSWLITVTTRQSFHWKLKHQKKSEKEVNDWDEERMADEFSVSPVWMEALEREQMVREAIQRLPERCRQLIQLLFYEHPPLPYREVGKRLGLATGSLGFIRGRCLSRLQKILQEMGF